MRSEMLCGTSPAAVACYTDALAYRDIFVVQAALRGHLDGLYMKRSHARSVVKRHVEMDV